MPEELKVIGGPDTKATKDALSKGAKSISLVFQSDEELALFAKIEDDAKADDRPTTKYLMRYIKTQYKGGA